MEKYVNQLVELLQEAHIHRPNLRKLDLPEDMKGLEDVIDIELAMEEKEKTMEQIFGVEQYYFPPEERLCDNQIQTLTKEILDLWHVFHYDAVTRKGEFTERQIYTKLVNCWKESFPLFRGTNGVWYIELYNYEKNWDEEKGEYVDDDNLLPLID